MLYVFPIIAIIVALVQILFFNQPFVETLLADLLFFMVGLGSLVAFTGHVFKSDDIATRIGWPTGNPFQLEVGWANLGYGVAGIMSMWIRYEFWTALVICVSVFYLGAGWVHVADVLKNKNKSELNIGIPLYIDFIVPIVLIVLLILYNTCSCRG